MALEAATDPGAANGTAGAPPENPTQLFPEDKPPPQGKASPRQVRRSEAWKSKKRKHAPRPALPHLEEQKRGPGRPRKDGAPPPTVSQRVATDKANELRARLAVLEEKAGIKPADAKPVVPTDPKELKPVCDMLSYGLVQADLGPGLTPEESDLLCNRAAPIATKYGGRIPYMDEIAFAVTLIMVFKPRLQGKADRQKKEAAEEKAAEKKAAVLAQHEAAARTHG